MNIDSIQEQRAKNIIWNAAGDYHFVPDYAAYEKDGEPSLYFNCIIGSVHRYYNYAPIHDMLLRLGRLREANLFRGLVWLGLERCTYEHALTDPGPYLPLSALLIPRLSGISGLRTGIRNSLIV